MPIFPDNKPRTETLSIRELERAHRVLDDISNSEHPVLQQTAARPSTPPRSNWLRLFLFATVRLLLCFLFLSGSCAIA